MWILFPEAFCSKEMIQRICGDYLAAVERYQDLVPTYFAQKTLPEIEKAYLVTSRSCMYISIIRTDIRRWNQK